MSSLPYSYKATECRGCTGVVSITMKSALLRTAESPKTQKSIPGTPNSVWPSPEDCEAQVKAIEQQLLSEFDTLQAQPAPSSSLSHLHHSYNSLLHANRVKDRKVQDLRNQLADLTLSNHPVSSHRSITAGLTTRSVLANKRLDPVADLTFRIESREEGIENEEREAERLAALWEKTQKAAGESRNKFQALQRRLALVLRKHEEVGQIQDKAKYDLQHARAQVHLVAEQCRKDAEKRTEKLEKLRKEKQEIAADTALTVKSLALNLVQGSNSKTVASAHATQLAHIYSQHLRNQSNRSHDLQSLDSLHGALATVCQVVNRSETLGLEVKVKEVKLGEVIGYAHQFEMKMASLESQVHSLSEAKQDLSQRCLATRADLDQYKVSQFQVTDLLSRIEGKLRTLALPQYSGTYSDLKQLLETPIPDLDSEDCVRQEAFLASAFMTFHLAIRRMHTLMDYIADQLPGEASLRVSGAEWTDLLSISNCDREDSTDGETLQFYFKDSFEDVSDWGLEADSLIKQACDLLIVRLFSVDSRLKPDLRTWKSTQLAIVGHNLHSSFLCKLISLSHDYLRQRLLGTCSGICRIVVEISNKATLLETDVRSIPLSDSQLGAFCLFQVSQDSGNHAEKAESESIKRAFELKYKKLMLQQRPRKDKKSANLSEPANSSDSEEANYCKKQRKQAKSSGLSEKPTTRVAVNKGYMEEGRRGEELEAFAQVRTMNLRIRSIRANEQPKSGNTPTHRHFPSIHSSRSLRSVYSPRLSTRTPRACS